MIAGARDLLKARIGRGLARDDAAPAIVHAGGVRDVGWLRRQVRAVDACLAGCGRVGLAARNRPAHVAVCLANLAAGRTTAMLVPGDSLAATIAALRLPAIVAERADWTDAALDAARDAGSIAIATDADGVPAVLAAGRRDAGDSPGDVALELLSSGTTGAPKRIGLSWHAVHGAVADAGSAYAGSAAPAPQVMVHPLGNVSGLAYAIPPLVFGRLLVLLDRFSVDGWTAAVRTYRPTRGTVPPAAIAMLLEADVPRGDLDSLDLIAVGGGRLAAELHDRFERRFGVPLLPAYGATEFGGVVANWTLADYRERGRAKRGSAGRASRGARLRVVAPDGTPCPPGATGLLEAAVERIGPGWIRTSDLARIDADGFLFVEGRADAAIDRGGFKVVPDAVADALRRHPAVRDAAVVGLPDARLGAVPVAAVEPARDTTPPDGETLRAWLGHRLPPWQVPREIRIVAALPRTPTMKVSLPGVLALFADAARPAR